MLGPPSEERHLNFKGFGSASYLLSNTLFLASLDFAFFFNRITSYYERASAASGASSFVFKGKI